MIKKHGSAKWTGGLKEGKGHVSTQTGVLSDQPYGFNTRFEGGNGTNPEELIGAAHAACFAMALSMGLEGEGLTAEKIHAKSTVSLEEVDGGFAITKVHVVVTASIPGADASTFQEIAEATKQGCPVSKVLTGAEITMEASLV